MRMVLNKICTTTWLTTLVLLSLPYNASFAAGPNPAASDAQTQNTPSLSYQTTQAIMASTAQVLKQQAQVKLLDYCSTTFKHLSRSAHNAADDWNNKHRVLITKAKDIKQYIYTNLAQYGSPFVAERLDLKIDAQIHQHNQNVENILVRNSRKRQHYLCNRLILSIAAGEWDLSKQIPEHRQRVLRFELKK